MLSYKTIAVTVFRPGPLSNAATGNGAESVARINAGRRGIGMFYYEETKQLKNGKWQSSYYDCDCCIYVSDKWESEALAKIALKEWKIKRGIEK